MGYCAFEETKETRASPSANDVVLITKNHMADAVPTHVVVLVSEMRAAVIRESFTQPSGVAPRREIAEQVLKNIKTYAPRCAHEGLISQDAANYLLSWSQGDWPRIHRPTNYSFLGYRQGGFAVPPGVAAVPWTQAARVRHIQLGVATDGDGAGDGAESDNDDGEPIVLAD